MAASKTSNRYFSNIQEKRVAKAVGGRKTSNSGATKFSKGDVSNDNWLFEAKTKTTPSESMSIKREWLDKNAEEAFAMGKDYSAVVIDFGCGDNYYIVDEKTFLRMMNALAKEESYDE